MPQLPAGFRPLCGSTPIRIDESSSAEKEKPAAVTSLEMAESFLAEEEEPAADDRMDASFSDEEEEPAAEADVTYLPSFIKSFSRYYKL